MQNGINVVHYIIIVILTSTHINSYMSEIVDIVRLKNCLYINMFIVEFSIAPRYSIPREWKNYAMQYKKVQKSKLEWTLLLLLHKTVMQ